MAGGDAAILGVGGLLQRAGGAEIMAVEGELSDTLLALKVLAGALNASRDLLESSSGAKPLAEHVHIGRSKSCPQAKPGSQRCQKKRRRSPCLK